MGVVFLTVHDNGSNQKPSGSFCSLPCIDEISSHALFVHVCLTGQNRNAADFGDEFPSMVVGSS
jgi:hypothetical protein